MTLASRLWLVTDADFDGALEVSRATFVEAPDAEHAAGQGMWAIWQHYREDGDAEPPHDAYVIQVDREKLTRYRAIVGAERVPDEFQCCGGMPDLETLVSLDEHTAICEHHRSVYGRWRPGKPVIAWRGTAPSRSSAAGSCLCAGTMARSRMSGALSLHPRTSRLRLGIRTRPRPVIRSGRRRDDRRAARARRASLGLRRCRHHRPGPGDDPARDPARRAAGVEAGRAAPNRSPGGAGVAAGDERQFRAGASGRTGARERRRSIVFRWGREACSTHAAP
jgi:hypothetical protein